MFTINLLVLNLLILLTARFSATREGCSQLEILSQFNCFCSYRTQWDRSTEYMITCDRLSASNTTIPLIQVAALNQNTIDTQSIGSLVIKNQQLDSLNQQIINSTLKLFTLEMKNDSIRSISSLTLSNLIYLKNLKINGNPIKSIDLSVLSELTNLSDLDLSENNLETIILSIGKKLNVRVIHLNKNNIKDLNGGFGDFPFLENIDLGYNLFETISSEMFLDLTQIETLNLESNKITRIEPNAFHGLANLEELYLDKNQIKLIDASMLADLNNLYTISLKLNALTRIMTNSFVSLVIEELDLSNQMIVSIDFGAIKECEYLQRIILNNNMLRRITSGFISDSPRLIYIDLSNNFIEELTNKSFHQLDNLEWLEISNNHIIYIQPGSFAPLINLKTLNIGSNYLQELDADMFIGLEKLKSLGLNSTKLSLIKTNTFKHLPNLYFLNLTENKISVIEPFAFIQLENLKNLELGSNRLVEITANMFKGLVNLNRLDLNSNMIKSIANKEAFDDLKNLFKLDISKNQLISLNSVSMISNLKILDLSYNQLKSLDSADFIGLNALEMINLEHNKLEKIDCAFENLTQLITISLNSNRMRQIDNCTFMGAQNIQKLDLSNNSLDKYFEREVFDLCSASITSLTLQNTEADPSEFINFSSFANLVSLDVSRSKFKILTGTFENISIFLERLYMSQVKDLNLAFLPMYKLKNLYELDLSHNSIDWSIFSFQNNTERFFNHNPRLMIINLKNTSLRDIECLGLANLKSLIILDLSNNIIEKIKADLYNNSSSIEFLYLSNNLIKIIEPDSFKNLLLLWELHMDGNSFNNFEQFSNIIFENFKNLYSLDITRSMLTQLPLFNSYTFNISYRDEYRLAKMYLSNNQIESISAIYFDNLPLLDTLDLSYNRISHVDSENVFLGAHKLVNLNLSSNLIDSKALGRINFNVCSNLKQLNLSGNYLTVLDRLLFNNLKVLEFIDISNNPIIQINPNTFFQLTRLKSLYMYNIRKISESSSSLLIFKENFISQCDSLIAVFISSLDLIKNNLEDIFSSLKAISANKRVNEADYYKSINIRLNNYEYYKLDPKLACKLTIKLMSHRIHLNLFNDIDYEIFFENCFSIDLTNEF